MSAPLSEQQLAEIRARAEAATAGPWEPYPAYGPTFYANVSGEYLRGVGDLNFGEGEQADADRTFTLAAPTDVPALLAEVERLRASAGGAHRRIDAVLDHLATLDAVQLSEDAGALGFHIVAVLDSPVRADEEVPARPALPWRSFLEDVEQSGLVEDLASLFLDYWRGDRPDDAATLREVERLLVKHRDGSQAAEAARAAHGDLDARAEREFAAEAGHGAPDGGVS